VSCVDDFKNSDAISTETTNDVKKFRFFPFEKLFCLPTLTGIQFPFEFFLPSSLLSRARSKEFQLLFSTQENPQNVHEPSWCVNVFSSPSLRLPQNAREYLCGEGKATYFSTSSCLNFRKRATHTHTHTHLSFMEKCQACKRKKTSCDKPFVTGKEKNLYFCK
jgi:hypothetical protein